MKGRRRLAERATWLTLHALQAADRLRLRLLRRLHPGLEIHPDASTNFAVARYQLAPGASLRIGPGCVTERLPGALHFQLGAGARVRVGEGSWLRTEMGPVHVVAYDGAEIEIGPEGFLNGCSVSAKGSVVFGRRVWVGTGSRVYDADQHDLDDAHAEVCEPVRLDDHVWVASDVTVLRGVRIGAHSVVGTRSLVTSDIPAHSLAFGIPARVRGSVGDRSKTP